MMRIGTSAFFEVDAALRPDTTDKYIYFVAIPDSGGKHAFAKTAKEMSEGMGKKPRDATPVMPIPLTAAAIVPAVCVPWPMWSLPANNGIGSPLEQSVLLAAS